MNASWKYFWLEVYGFLILNISGQIKFFPKNTLKANMTGFLPVYTFLAMNLLFHLMWSVYCWK